MVHRISLSWLHERLGNSPTKDDSVQLCHIGTTKQAADIYTKHFSERVKWQAAYALINICDPNDLRQIIDVFLQDSANV